MFRIFKKIKSILAAIGKKVLAVIHYITATPVYQKVAMFLVGLPAQHVIASVLKRLPKVTLESVIYEVRFSGRDGEKAPVIDPARIYTESALL